MSKEKQILQLLQDGYSQRQIASIQKHSCQGSLGSLGIKRCPGFHRRKTTPPYAFSRRRINPHIGYARFPYIHKELLKSG